VQELQDASVQYGTDLGYNNLSAGDKDVFYQDLFESLTLSPQSLAHFSAQPVITTTLYPRFSAASATLQAFLTPKQLQTMHPALKL
jgi:hypothetical protein